jgi:hypothetical protein
MFKSSLIFKRNDAYLKFKNDVWKKKNKDNTFLKFECFEKDFFNLFVPSFENVNFANNEKYF